MRMRAIIGLISVGAFAIVLFVMWLLFGQILALQSKTQDLTNKLDAAEAVLASEVARSQRIEEVTERLEESDAMRNRQLRQFEKGLQELSKQDESYRVVLDTIVPPPAYSGLRVFDQSTGIQPDTSSR